MVSADGVGEMVDFGLIPKTTLFLEGITLRLYCTQASTDDIVIRSSTQLIVERSNLVDGITEIYDFEKVNSTTCVLVIKNLTRNESGVYSCREGDKTNYALVQVLYSPSSQSPVCTSNYDSLVIVNDLPLDHINFTCTSDQGNPPVLMQLHIFLPNSTNNISSIQLENICTTHNQLPNSRLLSCRIDDSLENATFVCYVSQQFPPPYTSSYGGSCSFGPINFPPKFSLVITPSDNTVCEGDNVTLTCTTNITGVEINWIIFTEDWKHNVTNESEYSSQLNIYKVKKQSDSKIIVQCIGTYGIRKVRTNGTISFSHKDLEPTGRHTLVICIIVFLIFFGAFLLGFYAWRKRKHVSKSSNISRQIDFIINANQLASTSNTNNANNKSLELCNEDEEKNLDVKDRLNGEDTCDMCVNPVYESASYDADKSKLPYCEDHYAVPDKKDSQVI
ncbi:hypothetical protein HOLleu_38384 [Holothuria leucospilota]|uniref:Ig-like domain-containing protein n=1 Tax=Holothuria leucospilota TaxID=206669 RepID=A0A9Q0YGX7_HOLLE|nr:hypothetical protein HOLleu_38384 [Holothuria leucospilota]